MNRQSWHNSHHITSSSNANMNMMLDAWPRNACLSCARHNFSINPLVDQSWQWSQKTLLFYPTNKAVWSVKMRVRWAPSSRIELLMNNHKIRDNRRRKQRDLRVACALWHRSPYCWAVQRGVARYHSLLDKYKISRQWSTTRYQSMSHARTMHERYKRQLFNNKICYNSKPLAF